MYLQGWGAETMAQEASITDIVRLYGWTKTNWGMIQHTKCHFCVLNARGGWRQAQSFDVVFALVLVLA